ncbi:MAG TPA: Hsp20/alpha crystallin family protein [Candidatus Kryptonia bacterium]|nr:Hsp20/alpha crystallin family protein [Candidatus Kryptonia bacterium]
MRALTPWRPFSELSTLRNEIDNLFGRFFEDDEGWFPRVTERPMMPAVETFTRNGNLVVRADLPGIDPKLVELAVEGDLLTIKGERKEVHEEKGERGYREVTYGRFERTVTLPPGVDAESVKATYHDGVLEVTMTAPKGLVPKKVPITVH